MNRQTGVGGGTRSDWFPLFLWGFFVFVCVRHPAHHPRLLPKRQPRARGEARSAWVRPGGGGRISGGVGGRGGGCVGGLATISTVGIWNEDSRDPIRGKAATEAGKYEAAWWRAQRVRRWNGDHSALSGGERKAKGHTWSSRGVGGWGSTRLAPGVGGDEDGGQGRVTRQLWGRQG